MNLVKNETYTDCDFNVSILKEKRSGSFAYFCPHCNKVMLVDADINVDVRANTHTKTNIDINSVSFKIRCYYCKKDFTTQDQGIDPNIIDYVIRLNNAGYKTEFSCEGHFDCGRGEFSSTPYIAFKDSSIRKFKAPKNWNYESFGRKAILRYNGTFNDNIDKEKALDILDKWVYKIELVNEGSKIKNGIRNLYRRFNKNV